MTSATHFNFKSIPAEQLGHHLGSVSEQKHGNAAKTITFCFKEKSGKKVVVLASVKKDVFWSGTQVQTPCVGERIPSLTTKFHFSIGACSLRC